MTESSLACWLYDLCVFSLSMTNTSNESLLEPILPRERTLLHRRNIGEKTNTIVPSDDSSQSSYSSSETMDHHSHWLKQHYSNVFFFVGSLLFVVQAAWDVRKEQDDDVTTETLLRNSLEKCKPHLPQLTGYLIMSTIASLCYVADASLGLARLTVRARRRPRGFLDEGLLGIGVAFTFGLATLLNFASTVTVNDDCPWLSYSLAIAANHCYLINAVLELSGRPMTRQTVQDYVSFAGDTLFLIGSVVDVVLSYFFSTKTSKATWRIVDRGNLFSCVLWLIDSVLYITADYYTYSHPSETCEFNSDAVPLMVGEDAC